MLRTYNEFVAVAGEWRELFANAERPVTYLRHSWLRLSWELAARRFPNQLRVILVRRAGQLSMASCFVLGFRRLRPTVRPLSSTLPQHEDLLWRASPHTGADAALLLEALRGERWLPAWLQLRMRSDGLLSDAIAERGQPRRVMRRSEEAFVPLSEHANFGAYFESLSQNLKVDHRRRLRRFNDMPGFAHVVEPLAAASDTVAWLLDTKRAWLAERGGSTPWLQEGFVDRFYARLAATEDAGAVRVSSVRLGDRIVAGGLSLVERDWMKLAIVAHDPALNQQSPGRTLTLLEIAAAFDLGLREYDLGHGDLQWKRRLAPGKRLTTWERVRL